MAIDPRLSVKDMCVNARKKLSCIVSLVVYVRADCCYCLFDLAFSMVVQFGIVIRIRIRLVHCTGWS